MKKLTEEVTVVKALLPDIRKYVASAYTNMLEGYRAIGRPLPKLKNDNNIRFSISNDYNYWKYDFSRQFTQGMVKFTLS